MSFLRATLFAVVLLTAAWPAAARLVVLTAPRAEGDLDGDGRPEVAAVVEHRSRGTVEVYVAVFERTPAGPALVTTVRLDDRAAVDRLRIVTGRLTAAFRRHYPIDPPCCPSRETIRSYAVVGGSLHGADQATPPAAWRRAAGAALAAEATQPQR